MFRSTLVKAGVAAGLAAVALAAGVWYFYVRNDAPPPVSLATAIESLTTSTPETVTTTVAVEAASESTTSETVTTETETLEAAAPIATTSDDGLAGTWTVVQGENSFAGYRVEETLASIGATTAVGRTNDVEGTLEFDGTTITSVEITADLTTLESDSDLRDGQLRTQAIVTGTYPTATYVLTSPITVSEIPADGETVVQTVTGELTLHGVTQAIEIEVEAALEDGLLVVVGSTEVQFADYEIEHPVSVAVVGIEDHGTMEFQLVFALA